MKHIFLICIVLFITSELQAQYSLKLLIKDKDAMHPMPGATAIINSPRETAFADSSGIIIFSNLREGRYSITISHIGKKELEIRVMVPEPGDIPIEVLLEEEQEHEEEVIINSTRTSRSIRDIPTRVEIISGEELTEKANMKPGEIRMVLNESTGIQTQQTSATSYNSSIRIQGLDGRYTQILRDGFPLYAGFSGGLSLMQVTPLDLKQIEVIKGSSSTLYGGGAIAGLVNLVSKTPTLKKELSFLTNVTSAAGLDLSGFYRQRFGKIGVTVFSSYNTGSPFDPADIGLTAIPKFKRYSINPRIFLYRDNTTFDAGFSYITENRIGGSMDYIKKGLAGYFEKNNTERFTTQAQVTHHLNKKTVLNLKNSYSHFNRTIEIPNFAFKGVQKSSYSEASFNFRYEKSEWIIGSNFLTDNFEEETISGTIPRDYHYNTFGLFMQNTWNVSSIISLETGIRGDYLKQFGFEFLPRISAMMKITPRLTTRLDLGLGYKTPTIFNEEAEKTQFRNILSINEKNTRNERSNGGNFDINYRTSIGRIGFTLNQLFFYTQLNRPLILSTTSGGQAEFVNANGHIDTRGLETNVRLTYSDFKLFIGYTYADVKSHYDNVKSWFPLTARHRLNNVMLYEKEGNLKIGLEAYYFSSQKLNDGNTGRSYWIFGLMGEKTWKHFSIFLNFENFTDTRQTRFDTIYTGSINNPDFRDIYAPVDGIVVNGGIKIRL